MLLFCRITGEVHTYSDIHDEHLGTRLGLVYNMFLTVCNTSNLLFEILLKQKLSITQKEQSKPFMVSS